MKKIKKWLAFMVTFAACVCVSTSVVTVKGSAALVVPDDYEYEDKWDDSYLLDNLDGEQTINAEGTPPAKKGEEGETNGGCGASLTVGGAVCALIPALGVFLMKKKRD